MIAFVVFTVVVAYTTQGLPTENAEYAFLATKSYSKCFSVNYDRSLYISLECKTQFKKLKVGTNNLQDKEGNCYGPPTDVTNGVHLLKQPCGEGTQFQLLNSELLQHLKSGFCVHPVAWEQLVLWDSCDHTRYELHFGYISIDESAKAIIDLSGYAYLKTKSYEKCFSNVNGVIRLRQECFTKFKVIQGVANLEDESGNCYGPGKTLKSGNKMALSQQVCGEATQFEYTSSQLLKHVQSGYCIHEEGWRTVTFWNSCNAQRTELKYIFSSEGEKVVDESDLFKHLFNRTLHQ